MERFDEYPEGDLPLPWTNIGRTWAGGLRLSAEAESPFIGNKTTGKGICLDTGEGRAVNSAGTQLKFPPPPPGRLFIGFDVCVTPRTGEFGLRCQLASGTTDALVFDFEPGRSLTVKSRNQTVPGTFPILPGNWYRVTADFTPGGTAALAITDLRQPKQPQTMGTISCPMPQGADRISLTTLCGKNAQGKWYADNFCLAGEVDAQRRAWLPFNQAPLQTMRTAPRKVFAYYYEIFTSGYSDEDPGLTFYTRTTFNPDSSREKPWLKDRIAAGTEMLYHPLPRPRMRSGLTKAEVMGTAMEEEVRLARDMGLDGFLLDMFAFPQPQGGTATFNERSFALMDAAARMAPGFAIIPAIYSREIPASVTGEARAEAEMKLAEEYASSPVVQKALSHPQAYKLPDGRTLFSMWGTERYSPAYWQRVQDALAVKGFKVAFLGQFNGVAKERLRGYSSAMYGMSDWGPRTPRDSETAPYDWVSRVRDLTNLVVSPAVFQDVRTRGCAYWESRNSEAFRQMWETAIRDKADWVFIHTWSDYSEQAQAPSTAIGFSLHDLNTYYTQWFKTGVQPQIERDALYYFYRRHHTAVDPGKGQKWKLVRGTPDYNQIELLAFLRSPGELRIDVAGQTYRKKAEAGIVSFKVPLPEGKQFVPHFSLHRNGKPIVEGAGRYTVLSKVEYPNLMYLGGVLAGRQ